MAKKAKRSLPDQRAKKPVTFWITIGILVTVAVAFVVTALLLQRPMPRYNSDYEDASNVYFLHAGLALDANRLLFADGSVPEGYADDGVSLKYYEYEFGIVREVLADTSFRDPETENVHIGMQTLSVELTTGDFKGRIVEVQNQMSKLFDKHSEVGTRLLLYLYVDTTVTDAQGQPFLSVSVMNYNRVPILLVVILVFLAVTILVGRKVGLRSILGLVFTLLCIFLILVPALLRGFYAVPFTLLLCILVTIVCFLLLDGLSRKTVSAMLGTILGFGIACLFATIVGKIAHIDGLEYNVSETDTLVQARYQGTLINIRGLFVSGIIISALGAVMDVAMSISSSITELKTVNPDLHFKALFRSGMNIGRDAVGTMTNTLILAFTGSALVNLLLVSYYDWDWKSVLCNDYITGEIITGTAGSIGLILAVPITAAICSLLHDRTKLQHLPALEKGGKKKH